MKFSKLKINLLPKEEIQERALGKFLKWSLTFGRYIIVTTEIVVLLAFFSRFKFDRELTDIHEEITQKEAIVAYNQEFEQKVRVLQKKLAEVNKIEEDYDLNMKILAFLEKNTPKDIILEKLSLSQGKIVLSGESSSTPSFIDFLSRIRTAGNFSDVTLNSLDKKQEKELKFKLTAKIIKEGF